MLMEVEKKGRVGEREKEEGERGGGLSGVMTLLHIYTSTIVDKLHNFDTLNYNSKCTLRPPHAFMDHMQTTHSQPNHN